MLHLTFIAYISEKCVILACIAESSHLGILQHIRNISEYDKRLFTLLHAMEKQWNFSMGNAFQEEVDLHVLQSVLGKINCKGGSESGVTILQHVAFALSMSKRRVMM